MFNAQLVGIILVAAILTLLLIIGLVWRSRKKSADGTIAPYSELKRQIREGTAKPFSPLQGAQTPPTIPWDQILEIQESEKRYVEMGAFVVDKKRTHGYGALSENEQIILHTYLLEAEVNNGGFDQYFFNTAGNHARETVDSLRRIGAKQTLALLTQAIEAFGSNPPSSDRETRWVQMDKLPESVSDEWNRLDKEFYALTERLSELVVDYLNNSGVNDSE